MKLRAGMLARGGFPVNDSRRASRSIGFRSVLSLAFPPLMSHVKSALVRVLPWLLFPLALVPRLANWGGVFTPFGIFPLQTDPYFHLRRILRTVENFPRVPDSDRYVNFPAGAAIHWPFGYDVVYATIARVTFGFVPDEAWVVAVASILTPLFGSLTPVLGFYLAARVGGRRAGWCAGLLLALIRAAVQPSALGNIDHHVFESLFMAVDLLLFVAALDAAETRRSVGLAAASGVAVTGGILCTTILPLLVPMHALAALVLLARTRGDRAETRRLLLLQGTHWTATVVTLCPFVATRLAEPSGVNPALGAVWCVSALLGTAAFALALRFADPTVPGSNRLPLGGLGLCAALALVTGPRLATGEIVEFIAYGARHVGVRDPWLASIQESQPVTTLPYWGLFDNTFFYAVFPVALLFMLRRGWHRSSGMLCVAVMAAPSAVFAFLQLKFAGIFIVPFAAVSGWALTEVVDILKRRPRFANLTEGVLGTGVFLLLAWPIFLGIGFGVKMVVAPGEYFVNLHPTLLWMNGHTPKTTPVGDAPSDYAVACDWSAGHWVIYFAGRPVVASPFGHTVPMREAIRDGAAMFMSSPEDALSLIRRRRVRYVLVTPLSLTDTMRDAAWDSASGRTLPVADPKAALRSSLYTYLVAREGVPSAVSPESALRHFRLVHEGADQVSFTGFSQKHAFARLFEVVPGAVVTGTTTPGAAVTVGGVIRTASGRVFNYADSVTADAVGRFEIVLPYASGAQRFSEVSAPEGFRVTVGNAAGTVKVSEDDILAGRRLDLGAIGSAGK